MDNFCDSHDVIVEKLRVGELRMNKHGEKLDGILTKMNQILVAILICALGFAGTIYIASGRPDPAIERIEKLLVSQIGHEEIIATIADRIEK